MIKTLSSQTTEPWMRGLYQSTTSRNQASASQSKEDAFGPSSAISSTKTASSTSGSQQEEFADDVYATVDVNGETRATIYNDGTVWMPWQGANAPLLLLSAVTPNGIEGGPELAKHRAAEAAKQLGGTVTVASTAQTQAEWEAAHPDWNAQKNYSFSPTPFDDNSISAQTLHSVQTISQEDSDEESQSSDAVAGFREYMDLAHKGPGALLRAQYLESKGMTEDDVASMSEKDRGKLEKEITDFIKKKFEEETGVAVGETGVSSVA